MILLSSKNFTEHSCFVSVPKHWGFSRPITRREVSDCIKNKKFFKKPIVGRVSRSIHIERIAYLIVYGFKGLILIEPSRKEGESIFSDGNHRVAASIYQDIDIECEVFSRASILKEWGKLGEDIEREYKKASNNCKWVFE